MTTWLWKKIGWPRMGLDEHTGSEFVLLLSGRWTTGWGRPAWSGKGPRPVINRAMVLGRPYIKVFGRWERLRPGQPTTAQVVGSVVSRAKGVHEVLAYLLGDKEPPRGWGRQRLSKQQRLLLVRVRDEVRAMHSDVEQLIPALRGRGTPQ